MNTEADEIEKNIAIYEQKEVEGYWAYENHRTESEIIDKQIGAKRKCQTCESTTRFIVRSDMTGKEKYQLDKEREDAEKVAGSKRAMPTRESEIHWIEPRSPRAALSFECSRPRSPADGSCGVRSMPW